jgi:ribosome-associated protein
MQPSMQQLRFDLDRDHVELNQLLKLTGLCDSGGAGKALVGSGAVRVDGTVELRKTCKIRAGQRVRVGDVEICVDAAT